MYFSASFLKLIQPVLFALLLMAPVPALFAAQDDGARPQNDAAASSQEEDSESRRVQRLGDVSVDEYEMDMSIPVAAREHEKPQSEFDLPDPEQNARLQHLLSSLVTRPGNAAALAALDNFLDGVLAQAYELAAEGRLEEMRHLLGVVRNVNPRKSGLNEVFQLLQDLENVGIWLLAASRAMDEGKLVKPILRVI